MAIIALLSQAWAIQNGLHWQTIVFNVICLSQMGHVLAIRFETRSFFGKKMFTNKPLIFSVVIAFLLQWLVTYVPVLQKIFKTEALSLNEFLFVGLLSSAVFWAVEIEKWVSRRSKKAGMML
jgi:Ca2+-transporting ATPase